MTQTLKIKKVSTATTITIFFSVLFSFFAFSNVSYAGNWSAPVDDPAYSSGVNCQPFPFSVGSQTTGGACAPDNSTYRFGSQTTSQTACGGFPGEPVPVMNNSSIRYQTCNPSANNPPTANAGVNRSISLPTTSSAASGASASDADGSVASTVWSFQSGPGPTSTITNGTTLTPTFNGMSSAGTYTFNLRVTDNLGLFTDDTMTVTVGVSNPQCNDGIDNDGDGRTDTGDWGCHYDNNPTNAFTYVVTDDSEANAYCASPGWGPEYLVYDGDIGQPGGVNWCNNSPMGSCPANLAGGPDSVSRNGSPNACCRGEDYLGYLRECIGSSPTPVDAICGTGAGTTVATEPTGTSACTAGTLNSSSPADDPTTWRWTCAGLSGGADASCSANKLNYTLTTVIGSAAGSGDILSSPPGAITCPGDCTESYPSNTSVTITAAPRAGYSFSSWTGGSCAEQPSICLLTMSGNRTETANFVAVPAFNYSLGPNSQISTIQGSPVQKTITKTLTSGSTQTISLSVGTLPSGVSVSGITNQACNLTCSSVITFSVSPTAAVGTHSITVTGTPLNRQVSFNLVISPSAGLSASCDGNPDTALLGQNITWTALASGGVPPYAYSWSGTDIPTSPAPTTNPYVKSYSTIGLKSANITVTDSGGSTPANCTPTAATVQINFDPSFEEF